MDFLLEKIKKNHNIDYLKGLLDPTQRKLNIKNIEDTIDCLQILSKFKNQSQRVILKNIKELNEEDINKFKSYSKNYEAIKELENNNIENDDNIVKKVDTIIKNVYFELKEDKENFSYKKNEKYEKIELNDLIKLNSQISINNNKDEGKPKTNDLFEEKCEKLKFFKNLVADVEEMCDKMLILRVKGCYLQRIIKIEIKYPKIKYYLNGVEFEDKEKIKKFLFDAKIDFENKLNEIYKKEKYLRFLYVKIFRKIQLYISGSGDILDIMRYILNITDAKEIKDSNKDNNFATEIYYEFYYLYNIESFDKIINYIVSLFNKNNLDLEKHYKEILIKEKDKFKGFYFSKCEKISKEEYIICLFYEKLREKNYLYPKIY